MRSDTIVLDTTSATFARQQTKYIERESYRTYVYFACGRRWYYAKDVAVLERVVFRKHRANIRHSWT